MPNFAHFFAIRTKGRNRPLTVVFAYGSCFFQKAASSSFHASAESTTRRCSQWGGIRRRVSGARNRSSMSNTTPLSCGVRMTRPAACKTLFMPG